MQTHTGFISTIDDIEDFVHQHTIGDSPHLLIQFFSAKTDIPLIQEYQLYFRSKFPLAVLIGSTTDGVISMSCIDAEEKSLIVFTQFEKTMLQAALISHDESYHDNFQTGRLMGSRLIREDTKALITFTDGIYTNGEEYIKGIGSVNSSTVVSGGMAGDNGMMRKTCVFDKHEVCTNGAVGVALNSQKLQVMTDYSFDWTPIGKELRVTKAVKNRVYEVDGISAVELYSKYLGEELARHLPQIGIEYPLVLNRDGVLKGRAVLYKHDDGSLTFAGNIDEGESVRFGVGNVDMILRSGNYHLRHILDHSPCQIETFFIYSCMARRRFMGSYIETEIEPFSNTAPTAGFFTYGEFFHAEKKNRLLNESMTVLALSESEIPMRIALDNALVHENYYGVNPVHTIAHLANVVSGELEELNSTLETRIQENADFIYKQAYYDKLTKLPNRLKLIKELPYHVDSMLLLLNIDDFTLVNDFYGHRIGDVVLQNVAAVLRAFAEEENAIAFKLPSDEFAMILPHSYVNRAIEDTIQRLLSLIEKTKIEYDGYNIHITMTISAAMINIEGSGFINADMTLKLAKRAQQGYLIFDESLMLVKHYESNLKMANTLRKAIEMDDIIPHFQPIYNLKTGHIEKYECLVRLKQEDGEVLQPLDFLSMAQKIKLYPQITKIMIEKTFAFFRGNGLNFTVNLSFEDILNQETSFFIFQKIEELGIAKQLTFEILETQQMENDPAIKSFIERVCEHGANIAIDDFGSGFANFEHMTKINASYIKIDGSLIKNIDTDHNARLVVETIVIFAKKLQMQTVAEFVHSKEVLDIVTELEIDYAQGYYLGMPSSDI